MEVLFKTEVTPDQIDHLGHMNVRHYGANARTGAERLLASLGAGATGATTLVQRDTYTRHHREQLAGAPLEVRGGVVDVSPERIRLYEELVNADTDDVAATFMLTFVADRQRAVRPTLDDALIDAAAAATVEVPDRGQPRSIALDEDPAARAPSFEVVTTRDLALRHARAIDPTECDEDGAVQPLALAELVWGGEPVPGREFRPLERTADGRQIGFAILETRATWVRDAQVGDRVQSFGAELDIASKTMLSRNWLFDADRRDLVGVFTVVNIGFDIDARRSVILPDEVRERLSRRHHPDLA